MTHTQHIHLVLEEGIDRKVLATLRTRFLAVRASLSAASLSGCQLRGESSFP